MYSFKNIQFFKKKLFSNAIYTRLNMHFSTPIFAINRGDCLFFKYFSGVRLRRRQVKIVRFFGVCRVLRNKFIESFLIIRNFNKFGSYSMRLFLYSPFLFSVSCRIKTRKLGCLKDLKLHFDQHISQLSLLSKI